MKKNQLLMAKIMHTLMHTKIEIMHSRVRIILVK
jgi:hypothetical protein